MLEKLKQGGAAAVLIVVAIVAVVALAIGTVYLVGFYHDTTAHRQGETSKLRLVDENGNYIVGAYDHFHDLCGTIQSDQNRITNIKEALSTDPKPTGQQLVTLQASLLAAQQKFNDDVNQYNADSDKDYTEARFKDADLPFHISSDPKETVQCN